MAGSMSKANARQSAKHKVYYQQQGERTKVNKLITEATHIVRYNDTKAHDRLKQRNAMDKQRASKIAKSPKVRELLARS